MAHNSKPIQRNRFSEWQSQGMGCGHARAIVECKVAALMLRITIQEGPKAVTLVLEGKCRGPWVEELERCWRKAVTTASGRVLRVDLEKVGFVDERGKELLAEMYDAGVKLNAASGLMMISLVEEIMAGSCSAKVRA